MQCSKVFLRSSNGTKCRREAELLKRYRLFARFSQEFSNGAAQTANYTVFLEREDCICFSSGRENSVLVERLHRMHTKHAAIQAGAIEHFRDLNCCF